eukprot:g6174.t1
MGKHSKKTKLTKGEKLAKRQEEMMQKAKDLAEMEVKPSKNSMLALRQALTKKRAAVLQGMILQEMEVERPPLYLHCGRAFVSVDFDTAETDLERTIKEAETNLPQLNAVKTQFELKLTQEVTQFAQLQKDFAKYGY